MQPTPIIFLGTPEFAKFHLAALLKSDKFQVVGVVTQPDRPAGRKMQLQKSPVKILAEDNGVLVISPDSMRDPNSIQKVQAMGATAAVVVAYGQILGQNFLDLFPNKVVNVHGSLLPRWRGAAPIQRALMAGDALSGVSLQVMELKLDAGAIIGERRIELDKNMNATELYSALQILGVELLLEDLPQFLNGKINAQKQDESKVSIAPKLDKSECLIDWTKSAEEIHNHIRGLAMGPTAYTLCDGKKLKIHRSTIDIEHSGHAGQLLQASGDVFIVACGQGAIRVLEMQPDSKAKMSVRSFLAGHHLEKGARLG